MSIFLYSQSIYVMDAKYSRLRFSTILNILLDGGKNFVQIFTETFLSVTRLSKTVGTYTSTVDTFAV